MLLRFPSLVCIIDKSFVVESWTKLAPITGLTANSHVIRRAGNMVVRSLPLICVTRTGRPGEVTGVTRLSVEKVSPGGRRSRSGSAWASELSDFASPFVYLKSLLAQEGQQRKRWDSA